jgi:hypothetical protein
MCQTFDVIELNFRGGTKPDLPVCVYICHGSLEQAWSKDRLTQFVYKIFLIHYSRLDVAQHVTISSREHHIDLILMMAGVAEVGIAFFSLQASADLVRYARGRCSGARARIRFPRRVNSGCAGIRCSRTQECLR